MSADHVPNSKGWKQAQGQKWIALPVALLANTLLFSVLAGARTDPSRRPVAATAPIRITVMESPRAFDAEPDIQQIERDIAPMIAREASSPVRDVTPSAVTAVLKPLPTRVEAAAPDLPGLSIALPEASDLRSLPGEPITSLAGPLTLATVDRAPRRTSGALPRYPQWARQARLEGTVTLRFVVTPEGTVANVNIHRLDGDERLGRETMQTVAAWHFAPATKGGKPVACWCFQTVSFRLDD